MKLVLLGPPGAGKGTHAPYIREWYGVPHISTGDMLRDAQKSGSVLGEKAKGFMESGRLVPDELVIALVAERLTKDDAKKGFILDGFPRTSEQAEALDKALSEVGKPLNIVLLFNTTQDVIIGRLSGRRVCPKCGKGYHVSSSMKPKVSGICDVCGSALVQRPDDAEDKVLKRLLVYKEQTAPLIDYYKRKNLLEEVDGNLDVDPLNESLKRIFARRVPSTAR
jgi:adenylate kinase